MQKNKLAVIIPLLLFYMAIYAQPAFDIHDFLQKAQTAEWLCEYDAIAWRTSDSVLMADEEKLGRLGPEWFCYKTNDKAWHAIYGKYENNSFDLVFQFVIDSMGTFSVSNEPMDTTLLHAYSRALITANQQIKSLKDSFEIKFNQYILRKDDGTFTVWIFPAFQTDNYAVYGGEFIYQIDASGHTIMRDDSYYQGQFRAFKVANPREVWMDYTEIEKPTQGTVFFAWYYRKYFTSIHIQNKHYITRVFRNADGSYSWMHYPNKEP